MTYEATNDLAGFFYALFLGIMVACMTPLGIYLLRVLEAAPTPLDPLLSPVEGLIYRLCGADPRAEMDWKVHTFAFLLFSLFGTVLLFTIFCLSSIWDLGSIRLTRSRR